MALILRQIRNQRGITLDVLAARSGVSKPFLSQLERGQRGYTFKTMQSIADALEVGVSDLFDDTKEAHSLAVANLSEIVGELTDKQRRQVTDYALFLRQQRSDDEQNE